MRQILFYAKHPKQIEANAKVLDTDFSKFATIDVHSDNTVESIELDVMTKVFSKKGWECHWTCLEWLNLDNGTIKFFEPFKQTTQTIKLNQLSDDFAVIVFRIIGTVEGQRDFVDKAIDALQQNFSGLLINHHETMKYGIRKDYILELQINNFPVIPTKYFENTVTLDSVTVSIDNLSKYIIKPVTGELSNSLTTLDKVDENFLRRKESKVGGWLVQPLLDEIWDGEYQLVFFRDTFSHGCRKSYTKVTDDMLLPSQGHREINLYNPTDKEIELALSVRKFFENKLSKPIYTCRFDYLKMKNGDIKILEFEILNPGFFIGYLKDDEAKFNVAHKFALEINRILTK
jgi:hypothetical protein